MARWHERSHFENQLLAIHSSKPQLHGSDSEFKAQPFDEANAMRRFGYDARILP
jgi:hypothetical protein